MNSRYQSTHSSDYKEVIGSLIQNSIDTLHEMYVPNLLEFDNHVNLNKNRFKLGNDNTKNTLLTIIGLNKAENHNFNININIQEILKNQIDKSGNYTSSGELGLLLWATSLISPEEIPKILLKVNFNNILNNYKDARKKSTLELSWLLIGLLMASTFNDMFKDSVGNLSQKVYLEIRNNYGGFGLFRPHGKNSIVDKLQKNISRFTDQIYPIYALALYSQNMQNQEALLVANECAMKLCEHQGKNGEWNLQYDFSTGEVISLTKQQSVYNFALASMALFVLQKATNIDYSKYILRGLNWFSENKLFYEQIIENQKVAIPNKIEFLTNKKFPQLLNYLGIPSSQNTSESKISYEYRPYEFGCILYTFASKLDFYGNSAKTNLSRLKVSNLQYLNFSQS